MPGVSARLGDLKLWCMTIDAQEKEVWSSGDANLGQALKAKHGQMISF